MDDMKTWSRVCTDETRRWVVASAPACWDNPLNSLPLNDSGSVHYGLPLVNKKVSNLQQELCY